ncbi:MAG: hypothetical protein QOJ04_2636 [Caballeronia sp.]|jgi:M6 family metalloprotease-like protein|nr:hypothetical protein [Caballeronia sp.]
MRIAPQSAVLWLALFGLGSAAALEAPKTEAEFPSSDLGEKVRHFTTKRGYISLTRTVLANRAALSSGLLSGLEVSTKGGVAIKGQKSIPVIMLKYKDTGREPYAPSQLQNELFGSWPSGTMTDFYKEISYGAFSVRGTVYPWIQAKNNAAFYEGPIVGGKPCHGMCQGNRLGDLLTEVLDEANKTIDFSMYDNDGPDGVPNSGDDDGYVDFVAFVHPGKGGECNDPSSNSIWSHRFRLSDLTGRDYETKDLDKTGRKIRIDDYVIMPALDCSGNNMIQIGVFAHEFGHAFGLPDLYDTSNPARTQGVGNWDLMGAGSWGGDGKTPSRPAHMSTWSKDFLGWITPTAVSVDRNRVELRPVEKFPDALRVNITPEVYYLVEYRTKTGYDDSLTGPGLNVWRINGAGVRIGLLNNSVNADPTNPGVYLIQADGKRELDSIDKDKPQNRGDAGDPFPGLSMVTKLDNSTNPATVGKFALCNIKVGAESITMDVRVTDGICTP